MTALVTADWHLTEQPKDRYRFRAMSFIADLIDKYKVDDLLILGDLTHSKNYHPDTLVNDVVDLLYNLSCMCQIYVLRGNHDYIEAGVPFFHFVRLFKRVRWINQPTFTRIKDIGSVLFLPHTRDYKKDWNWVEWTSMEPSLDIIFAHNTFDGAISETGSKMRGIPLNALPDHVPVIAGDVHKPQQIQQLTYVGAPYTQKFGDSYAPRVILVHNQDESTHPGFESIAVPGPQKVLLDVSSAEELDECLLDCDKDDMVKIRFRLTSEQKDQWPETLAAIKKSWPGAIVQPIVQQSHLQMQVQRKDDHELVQDYGTQQKLSNEVLNTGHELIDER